MPLAARSRDDTACISATDKDQQNQDAHVLSSRLRNAA